MKTGHISLSEAAKRCPGRPSSNAIWRWCRKGIKSRTGQRVRLEHVRIGGKIYTSPEAMDRFFAEVARQDTEYFKDPDPVPPAHKQPSDKQRQRSIEEAGAELRQAGI